MIENASTFFLFIFLLVIFLGCSKRNRNAQQVKIVNYGVYFQNKQILVDLKLFDQLFKHVVKIYYAEHHKRQPNHQVILRPTAKFTRFRKIIYVDFPNQLSNSRENAIIKLTELKTHQNKYQQLSAQIGAETMHNPLIYIAVFYHLDKDMSKIDYVIEKINLD